MFGNGFDAPAQEFRAILEPESGIIVFDIVPREEIVDLLVLVYHVNARFGM